MNFRGMLTTLACIAVGSSSLLYADVINGCKIRLVGANCHPIQHCSEKYASPPAECDVYRQVPYSWRHEQLETSNYGYNCWEESTVLCYERYDCLYMYDEGQSWCLLDEKLSEGYANRYEECTSAQQCSPQEPPGGGH